LQLLAEHLLLIYAQQKLSKWFTEQYILKSMQPTFSPKNPISLHYAHNVFFKGPFSQSPIALLKNGHLFFVHFHRAMPFLFWTFIESVRVV
jgi:hypothetical protein